MRTSLKQVRTAPPEFKANCFRLALSFLGIPRVARGCGRFCVCHWLTTDQLFRRDLAVFRVLKDLVIPVAWNLAGGYQEPLRKVLDIHDNTMRACHAVYVHAITKGQRAMHQLEFASDAGVVGRT